MATFATVAAEIVAGVLNSHPNTTTHVKAAMVRQLLALQAEQAPFMERSGSFSTIANQAAYTGADAGFPEGLLTFQRLYYDMGSYARPIEPTDVMTIRRLQETPAVSYPFRACWWQERLQFGPAPAGVYVVKWDIVLDSTKDETTGALITEASTTQTNPWLDLPQLTVFKHLVWSDYFAVSPDQRPELAASHQQAAATQLARLREAGKTRQGMSAVAVIPSAWGNYSPEERRTAGVSLFFPGAPV